jgi:hypothetical protein
VRATPWFVAGKRQGQGERANAEKEQAMRVQTFVGKVSVETLKQMDEYINEWLAKHDTQVKFVTQAFGNERHSHHQELEPVVVTSVWHE